MKKIIIFAALVTVTFISTIGQVSTVHYEKGAAKASKFLYENEMKSVNLKTMPSLDVRKLLEEDAAGEESELQMPYSIGYIFDVKYTIEDGTWKTTEKERIWRLRVKSKNAISVNFTFSKLKLSPGAELYIFNSDKTSIYGPVKSDCNFEGTFLTDLLWGDEAIIQITEPIAVKQKSEIVISNVIHGYREPQTTREIGDAHSCHKNVLCYSDWLSESNSVAMVMLLHNGRLRTCSGGLLNNTNNDKKGYFLSAFHCIDVDMPYGPSLSSAEIQRAQNWAFRFQFKATTCASSSIAGASFTYNGATIKSTWIDTDFALMQINASLSSPSFPLTFAGWNRSSSNPASGTGIHHPKGDLMKYSSTDGKAVPNLSWAMDWEDADRNITSTTPPNTHWAPTFTIGGTEPGSSGSPLFDKNHRVVGQLHGGNGICGVPKYYGRLDKSWTGGGTSATRLRDWLDPKNNSSVTTTDHLKVLPVISQQIRFQTVPMSQTITIYPISPVPFAIGYKWEWASPYSSSEARIIYSCPTHAEVAFYKPFFATGMEYRLIARPIYDAQGTTSPHIAFTYYFQVVPSIKSSVSASAYPNPVSDILNIKIDTEDDSSSMLEYSKNKSSVKEYLIKLYDGSGNMLQSKTSKEETLQLNVSKYPAGYYYLHIFDNINKDSEGKQIVILKK